MIPRPITERDMYYWGPLAPRFVMMTGPGEVESGIEPCPAIATTDEGSTVVRVAWELDELELAHLARGGTLWVSTWGGLPVHSLHVQPPHIAIEGP